MGIVFQNYALFENMTVLQNVQYALKIKKKTNATSREVALEMIKRMGLEEHMNKKPNELSEVNEFLVANPHWQNRLAESHSEVAFQILNDGKCLQYSKHTEEGIQERIAILRSYDFDTAPLFIGFKPTQYADILDAFSLALSAKLGYENGFRTIPPKAYLRQSRPQNANDVRKPLSEPQRSAYYVFL